MKPGQLRHLRGQLRVAVAGDKALDPVQILVAGGGEVSAHAQFELVALGQPRSGQVDAFQQLVHGTAEIDGGEPGAVTCSGPARQRLHAADALGEVAVGAAFELS